jgi:hypothetical protein
METLGALIQALNGEVEIFVRPTEDLPQGSAVNYDAYTELDASLPPSVTFTSATSGELPQVTKTIVPLSTVRGASPSPRVEMMVSGA